MSYANSVPVISVYMRINHESMRGLLRGILLFGKTRGPWNVRLVNEAPYLENDGNIPSVVQTSNPIPDGIIAWGNNDQTSKALCHAIRKGIPVVLINPWEQYSALEELSGCDKVICDSHLIGRRAAEFYLEKNYTNFAYIGARTNVIWSRLRGEGFAQTLSQNGFEVSVFDNSNEKAVSQRVEENRLKKWLGKLPAGTGLFAAMDARGKQIIDLCGQQDISVPNQISVLSVDNDEFLCQMATPSLSSIRLDLEKAGFEAARMLQERFFGTIPESRVYKYGIKFIEERESTETINVNLESGRVVETIKYIKANCSAPITVASIAKQLGISRRTLEKTFRAKQGYTVLHEILQQRLRKLRQLLRETDIPMSDLAGLCGFTDDSYMGKVFRKYYGITMLAFRKQSK